MKFLIDAITQMTNMPQHTKFYFQVVELLQSARNQVIRTINQTMVLTYYEIGRMIVEQEQGGKDRADYGKQLLKGLSDVLKKEFGRGFSVSNLQQMRTFYMVYQKQQTLSVKSEKLFTKFFERCMYQIQSLNSQCSCFPITLVQ